MTQEQERLIDFAPKPTVNDDDIIYFGDMEDSGAEVQGTLGQALTNSAVPLKVLNNLSDLDDVVEAQQNMLLEPGVDVQPFNVNLENISAMDGDDADSMINLATLSVEEGSNKRMGVATLSSGSVTVSNTLVAADSRIMISPQNSGANDGFLTIDNRVNGTSFDIVSSDAADDRQVAWIIFSPA